MSRWPEDSIPRETILFSSGANTYSLVEPLGEGGNATTFLVLCASGPARGLPFAAKFFLNDKADRRQAFLREIGYLNDHPHPAILTVHDYGQTFNGRPYYISRYMATTMESVIKPGTATLLDPRLPLWVQLFQFSHRIGPCRSIPV
jgi:serine/threonine protein kinase